MTQDPFSLPAHGGGVRTDGSVASEELAKEAVAVVLRFGGGDQAPLVYALLEIRDAIKALKN